MKYVPEDKDSKVIHLNIYRSSDYPNRVSVQLNIMGAEFILHGSSVELNISEAAVHLVNINGNGSLRSQEGMEGAKPQLGPSVAPERGSDKPGA